MKDNQEDLQKFHRLKEDLLFETLLEGFAAGMQLNSREAKRVLIILLVHNTADFLLNRLFGYYISADPIRDCQLEEQFLCDIDLLKKAKALKKFGVIGNELFNSLAKLNDMRVAIAHGKPKEDPRLKYKGVNVLETEADIFDKIDEETVRKLLERIEHIRRVRISKDKWPEKPFIPESYDKDRQE